MSPLPPVDGMSLIAAERQRQIDVEGYTPDHDREHGGFVLSQAASCYFYDGNLHLGYPTRWPWTTDSWKPRDPISNLIRAGALYLAAAEQGYFGAREAVNRCTERLDACLTHPALAKSGPNDGGDTDG